VDNRRAFKRRVFQKTLKKYLSQAGIPTDSIDLEALDLDSYERLYDLIYDLAHNSHHELQPVFAKLLRSIHKAEEYYGPAEDLYEQVGAEEEGEARGGAGGEGDRLKEIEASIGILEKRVSQLENMAAVENKEVVTELHNAIYELSHDVATLRQKLASVEEQVKRPGRRPDGPRRRAAPGAEEETAPGGLTGAKLIIAGTISVFLAVAIIPMAAYTNGWTFSETLTYGAAFIGMSIGLMVLEGLWARVAFPNRRRTAQGFVTGYLYSQGTNPYKNG